MQKPLSYLFSQNTALRIGRRVLADSIVAGGLVFGALVLGNTEPRSAQMDVGLSAAALISLYGFARSHSVDRGLKI